MRRNEKIASLLVIEECSTMTELLAHKATSLIHSHLEGSNGLSSIAKSRNRDAWTAIGGSRGEAEIFLSYMTVSTGMVFSGVGSSSILVEGLDSIGRSG